MTTYGEDDKSSEKPKTMGEYYGTLQHKRVLSGGYMTRDEVITESTEIINKLPLSKRYAAFSFTPAPGWFTLGFYISLLAKIPKKSDSHSWQQQQNLAKSEMYKKN